MTRSPRLPTLLLLAAATLAAPAFAQDGEDAYPITPMASSWVRLDGHRYSIEIAQTDAQRARGLMFRDHMDPGHGMLFIHGEERPLAYWMKNTRIPLDIYYFDAHRRLVSVSKNTPACTQGNACPPFQSDGPAKYVLELNAGIADRTRAKKGDELKFGPGIPAAPPPDNP